MYFTIFRFFPVVSLQGLNVVALQSCVVLYRMQPTAFADLGTLELGGPHQLIENEWKAQDLQSVSPQILIRAVMFHVDL